MYVLVLQNKGLKTPKLKNPCLELVISNFDLTAKLTLAALGKFAFALYKVKKGSKLKLMHILVV